MARIALISDIHGNENGLQAVLEDAADCRCDQIICLGDLVDGGEDNDSVVRYIRDHAIPTVRGNHDEMNGLAFAPDVRAYLQDLPETIIDGDVLYTHISPRRKKAKIIDAYEAWNVFDETEQRLVFVGHAHIPMLFGEKSETACVAVEYPVTYNQPFLLDPSDRYIICVGAIGYPRDGIRQPRYCI